MLCCWCNLPCYLLLARMQFWAKLPPSSLLAIARVSGSDKLYNSSLIYRRKLIMAMAQWLTLLECQHIQLNVPSLIDLRALVKSSHAKIIQKDCILVVHFHPLGTVMHLLLYVGLPTSTLPAVSQCMHTCHFCQKPQLTFSGSHQCYLGQIYLVS